MPFAPATLIRADNLNFRTCWGQSVSGVIRIWLSIVSKLFVECVNHQLVTMDVVNGKIVSSNSKPGSANSDRWSPLQPSRNVLESMAGPYPHGNTEAGQGRTFNGVSPPRSSWGAAMAPSHGGGTRMASSMPSEPGTGRWYSASKDNILGQPHKQFAAAPSFGSTLESPLLHSSGMFSPAIPGATNPQPGWKVPDSGAHARLHTQSARSKSSTARLDKEMNRFESQLYSTISCHLEIPELGRSNLAAEELGLVAHAGADHTLKRQEMEEVAENEVKGVETGTGGVTDKKQKMKLFETDQVGGMLNCSTFSLPRSERRKGLILICLVEK